MRSNAAVPPLQLEDYRLMEPSPSPPATTRATASTLYPHDPQLERYTRDEDALWRDSTSPSMPSHARGSGGSGGSSGERFSASARFVPPVRSASDLAAPSQSSMRRSTSCGPQRPASVAALAARPINVQPSPAAAAAAAASVKRRSGSLTAVPAPPFDWRERESMEPVREGKPDRRRADRQPLPTSAVGPARDTRSATQHRSSDGSVGGCRTASSSAVSQRRRTSLLAPDPRDCVDLHDEADGVDVARSAPQPPAQKPCAPPESAQPARRPAPSLNDDLAALVMADTVGRCRSNSRGQVDLVDDRTGEAVIDAWLPTSQRAAAPARPDIEEEEEEESEADSGDGDEACEFEQEFFYYPAAGEGEEAAAGAVDGAAVTMQTPSRAASPSSSLPRWVRSIAEETPFTPFALACAATGNCAGAGGGGGAAATPLVMAPSPFLGRQGPIAANVAATAVAARLPTAPTPDQRLGHAAAATDAPAPTLAPRLAVQDLVVALLAAAPVCPGEAGDTATPLATAGSRNGPGLDAPVNDEVDDDDEPLPRQPSANVANTPETQQVRERLCQRVRQAHARLSYVDALIARFDAVVAARQAELAALQEKQSVVVQQTESYATRAAAATREVRRLRERQHGRDEVRLLRDMMADKENRLRVAQHQLTSLQRLWRQLQLLHAAAGTSLGAASATVAEETHEEVGSTRSAPESPNALASLNVSDVTVSSATQTQQQQQQVMPVPRSLSAAAASPLLPPTRQTAARGDVDVAGGSEPAASNRHSAEAEGVSAASNAAPPSPARSDASHSSAESSVASLGTCDALSDFLEELLGEVEGLAKVCIQLPSAPPAAASLSTRKGRSRLASRQQQQQQAQHQRSAPRGSASARSRPTYSALNRRLNDGNNGFFSFFGGATEAHLDSKPLSTFLANLDRLAQAAWEREEELQLRARELATEQEEDDVKARVAAEFATGAAPLPPPLPHSQQLSGSMKSGSGASAEKADATSPLSPGAPLYGEEEEEENPLGSAAYGAEDAVIRSPLYVMSPPGDSITAQSDRTTRQLFLSSPEHGRRSHGNSSGSRTPTRAAALAATSPSSSPLPAGAGGLSPVRTHGTRAALQPPHRNRVSAAPCLMLPTLVYAYPRVAAVSQHLDAEQQRIQADYATAVEAERQTRRQRAVQLRDAYREHVAPALRRAVDALRRQQASIAAQLAELGVRAVTVEWEEVVDDADPFSDAALLRGLEEARAAGQRPLLAQRRRGRSRVSVRSSASRPDGAEANEESWYGGSEDARVDDPSRCASLMRWENGDGPLLQQRRQRGRSGAGTAGAGVPASSQASTPPCRVYHRTLRVVTSAAQDPDRATTTLASTSPSAPHSARVPRDSERHGRSRTAPQRRRSSGRRSAGERPSPRTRHSSATPVAQRQSAAAPPPTGHAAPSPASTSKTCAALRLCTHTPSKTLLERRETQGRSAGKTAPKAVQPSLHTSPGGEHGAGDTPIATAAFRRSGGTPRASDAPATRPSTTTTVGSSGSTSRASGGAAAAAAAVGYAPESHPSRTRGRAAAALSARGARASASPSAPVQRLPAFPIIEDTRVLITEDAHHSAGGVVSGRGTLSTPNAGAADVWRHPFEQSSNALADGAVRVAVTFAGAEARRRLAAQEQQEAYQREFWRLREELARVDEDVFQLRTRWTELQRTRQATESEQRAKLAEAEAKVMKCRGFCDSLRRENKEWEDIRDELQRVLRGEEC